MDQPIDVEAILHRQTQMEAEKSTLDSHCLEIAELMLPRQAEFFGAHGAVGDKRTRKIIDEHAMQGLDTHSAIIEGFMMPRQSQYQLLEADDADLMKNYNVRTWFENKTALLFSLRYAPRSGFTTQIHESVTSLGAFGNQGLWVDVARNGGIYYRSEFFGQLYWQESFEGRIDLVHKKFKWTARKAVQKWGAAAPDCAQKAMRDNQPEQKHDYLHVVMPRVDAEPGRLDAKGMPIASAHISIQDRYLIDEGGYRSMPLICSRYEKSPLEEYGRGPGMKVLPATKSSQAVMRSLIRLAQMDADPPMGMPNDGVLSRVQWKPGGMTTGGVDEMGRRLVQPLTTGGRAESGMNLLSMLHDVIDQGFLVSLLELATEAKSHVSAAAVMQRAGEKGLILQPVIGRQENELLSPMTDREMDCLGRLGLLDDMPGELIEAKGQYRIRYENPLSRAMRAEQASGFFRVAEGVGPIAQIDPDFATAFSQTFDPEVVLRGLADINGVPTAWTRSADAAAAIKTQRLQQAQMQNVLNAAPVAGKVAKDLSDANATASAAA